MADELKSCPFCGSTEIEQEETITDAAVICRNCGSRTGLVFLGASEASNAAKMREQRDLWNTRAPSRPPADQVPDMVERVARAILDSDIHELLWRDGFPEREATVFAKAALQAVPASGEVGWQPIESAPKDGTPCILFARAKNATAPAIIIGWYIDGEWIEGCYAPNHPVGLVPTHWMPNPPFPEPPALKASGEE